MSTEQKITIRTLARKPGEGWRIIGTPRALAIHRGDTLMPDWAGLDVDMLFVHLDTSEEAPMLVEASRALWRFDSHGRIDEEHVHAEIQRKITESNEQEPKTTRLVTAEEIAHVVRLLHAVLPPPNNK